MSRYLELLKDRKIDEAESLRKSLVPKRLVKFFSLGTNDELNKKKFETLKNQQLWFSPISELNDPYEFQCMFVDQEKLKSQGYDDYMLSKFDDLVSQQWKLWALTSLSVNSLDCLPMWAYYTNNYHGFCVEYEVLRPDAICAIDYEPDRIPLASIILHFYEEFSKMIEKKQETNLEVEFYATLLKHQLFIKHESWKNEREYRIIFPSVGTKGFQVNIADIGLKASKIVVGLNCTDEHKAKLNEISNKINCGNALHSKISGTSYTLLEV